MPLNRFLTLAGIILALSAPQMGLADGTTSKHLQSAAGRTGGALDNSAVSSVAPDDARARWPNGMADMLSRPDAVWDAMTEGARRGQAEAWLTWMTPGLNAGGSMYWWLLSDLRAEQGQTNQAYMAAVQAYVWTVMDEPQCTGSSRAAAKAYGKQLIAEHPILLQTQDRALFHQAVLSAVDQAQAILQKGTPGLGMICLRADVMAAQQRAGNRNARGVKTMTIRAPSASRVQAILNQQASTLKRIKEELGYGKAWKESTITDAWTAAQAAQN
jgi:hypothetical protein